MKFSLTGLLTSSAMAATVAMTSTIATAPAQAFQISIDPSFNSTENTGASALLNFNFSQSGTNVKLDLGITNTTNGTRGLGATQATLVGLAFDAGTFNLGNNVTFSSYDAKSSGFTKLWENPSLPPYGTFDVGISPERNSFAGGNPQTGLTAGNSTAVSFLFNTTDPTFTASYISQQLENAFNSNNTVRIAARFQQVNVPNKGSDKVLRGPTQQVPEPATITASVLALGGFGFLKKKFKQKQAV